MVKVLGSGTASNLDSATYGKRWMLYQRNAANTLNLPMTKVSPINLGAGHWIRSLDDPAGGQLGQWPGAQVGYDPTDPAYASGYLLTLTTQGYPLTWEYLGDRRRDRTS